MSYQRIRLLYLNPVARISGAERSLLALWHILDKKFQPFLVVPEEGPLAEKAREKKVEVAVLSHLPRWERRNRWFKFWQTITGAWELKKFIQQKGIALLHVNSVRSGLLGGLAAKLSRIPCILHVRDIYFSPFTSEPRALLLDFLSDALVAVSEATSQSIQQKRKKLARKIRVIYNGLDLREIDSVPTVNIRQELGFRPQETLIGYFGLISPVKGLAFLLEAGQKIIAHYPDTRILVVGQRLQEEDRAFEEKLKEWADRSGLASHIHFLGWRDDSLAIMKAVDIVVHPAVYPEPLPRALLEAAACCRPIVATQVGGIPEIIENGVSGLLVPPGESAHLAEAIISLLQDKSRAQQLGMAARRKIELKFDLREHGRQIEELYSALLEKKR